MNPRDKVDRSDSRSKSKNPPRHRQQRSQVITMDVLPPNRRFVLYCSTVVQYQRVIACLTHESDACFDDAECRATNSVAA